MSRNGFSSKLLEQHLADLRKRQTVFASAHPELGPLKLRRAYWEQESRRGCASERRKRRKEMNELLKLIKESQPFW